MGRADALVGSEDVYMENKTIFIVYSEDAIGKKVR